MPAQSDVFTRAKAMKLLSRAGEVAQRQLANIGDALVQISGTNRDRGLATPADLRACYRLLLGREPDTHGLDHHTTRIQGPGIPLHQLVDEFMGSAEFARAHGSILVREGSSEVVGVDGFKIHVDPRDHAVGYPIARSGTYEPGVSATIRSLLNPGSTFVDVGANIGWFTLLAATLVGAAGKVVAVEPNPKNTRLLAHSVQDNSFDNVSLFTAAVSDTEGLVALETDASNGRMIPLAHPISEPVGCSYVLGCYILDDLLAKADVEHVDVMKIDVEGAEQLVLKGADKTLKRDTPTIVTEMFPAGLDAAPWGSAAGYLAQLRELGYKLSIIDPKGIGEPGIPGDQGDDEILSAVSEGGVDHVDLLAIHESR